MRSDGGQEAWKKGCKRVASADDRLMGTTQTVRERSRNIIRSLQGHDQKWCQEVGAVGPSKSMPFIAKFLNHTGVPI